MTQQVDPPAPTRHDSSPTTDIAKPYEPTYSPYTPSPSSGGSSIGRHFGSLLIGLLLPPVALVLFDWGLARYWYDVLRFSGADSALWPFAVVAAGAALLLVVAAAGRLSWIGPALAGLLYGVAPTLAIVLARDEVLRIGSELRDSLYAQAVINAPFYGFLLYPTIAALLLGTAIASARRRRT
ncbi:MULTISPECIES: hypothetical protein [Mumia]|uniref:hypothetical protein n=1 Tax=Mumia TaxID=1546255 RepID=UPI00141E53D2|nr:MULTISPECIES: hypothetical protein [unclassified Mumia]QMW66914.1 hypothetical protein H4N58_02895 [Mumia sp. ZJ1417]